MRIGLAGTGRIGACHAAMLCQLDQVGSLVVSDVDTERARAMAVELGVEYAADLDTLLSAGLDGLVVAAATDAHPELILRSVDAGIPVFCEKPVAADIPGTRAVLRRIEDAEVPVQIGFQRRFDAGYVAARAAVAAGELGWLHTIRATTLDPAPPAASYLPSSGGIFRDCAVHDFDAIRWVTGGEVAEVYALGANRGAEFFAEAGDVDTAAAMLTLTDGTLAMASATRYNAAGYDVRMELLGSEDSLVVGLDDRVPLRSAEPAVSWPPASAYQGFLERFRPAYLREFETFVEVVAGRLANPCTVADALEAFYIAEACELSRARRRPVALPEVRAQA